MKVHEAERLQAQSLAVYFRVYHAAENFATFCLGQIEAWNSCHFVGWTPHLNCLQGADRIASFDNPQEITAAI